MQLRGGLHFLTASQINQHSWPAWQTYFHIYRSVSEHAHETSRWLKLIGELDYQASRNRSLDHFNGSSRKSFVWLGFCRIIKDPNYMAAIGITGNQDHIQYNHSCFCRELRELRRKKEKNLLRTEKLIWTMSGRVFCFAVLFKESHTRLLSCLLCSILKNFIVFLLFYFLGNKKLKISRYFQASQKSRK